MQGGKIILDRTAKRSIFAKRREHKRWDRKNIKDRGKKNGKTRWENDLATCGRITKDT